MAKKNSNPLVVINRVNNNGKEVLLVLDTATTKLKMEGRTYTDSTGWKLEATENNLGFATNKLVKEIKRRSLKEHKSKELSKLCDSALTKARERNSWFAQYALAI